MADEITVEQWRKVLSDHAISLPEDAVRHLLAAVELRTQSDRGAAMIAAADLEDKLEDAIKLRLNNLKVKKDVMLFDRLFSGYGPLGSLAAKTDLAFAIGLIGERTYRDLDIIRDIRNKFAHRVHLGTPPDIVTFKSPEIASKCNNLWFPKNDIATQVNHDVLQSDIGTARGQYLWAASQIGVLLWMEIKRTDAATHAGVPLRLL